MIGQNDFYDGPEFTMEDIVIAAMVLMKKMKPGHYPAQHEMDNALFHLSGILTEQNRVEGDTSIPTASQLSVMLAARMSANPLEPTVYSMCVDPENGKYIAFGNDATENAMAYDRNAAIVYYLTNFRGFKVVEVEPAE